MQLTQEQRDHYIDLLTDPFGQFKLEWEQVNQLSDDRIHSLIYPAQCEPKQRAHNPRKLKDKITVRKISNLLERFSYDPDTGELSQKIIETWNGSVRIAEDVAPVSLNRTTGYLIVSHAGKKYAVHRLAWLLMTGEEPKGAVYHLNGDKQDNRWSNLGDKWGNEIKKFQAKVRVNGKAVSLGYFRTAEECEAAKTFFKNLQKTSSHCEH